ncbi:hypothetical protein EDEG_01981 [Edhazardia aedis USNM 41457]|uniref:Uncharacterized protein n=1 Tax=Edhazardia aedis (strain USNM 41457) TaxID=1003232 RepID=J9D7G7_EDHAE|nr:hypothetical protein EDEG_01981 [Edhazardia aedis USNM 41457]|eukprot:EJW03726.1 hypothetical protein EDEG_01981 [Edhazardia aedis USNM 41457]
MFLYYINSKYINYSLPFTNQMYNNIGFLEPGIEIETLERDETDNLSDIDSDELDSEKVYKEDILLYATLNSEELGHIEFHTIDKINNLNTTDNANYPKKETIDFFVHHDILIVDTMVSSAYLKIGTKHYVAVSGFHGNIGIYNCFRYNQFDPDIFIEAHDTTINHLTTIDNLLVTGSDDMHVKVWDLEVQKPAVTQKYDVMVKKVAVQSSNNIVVSSDTSIIVGNNKIECSRNLENLKLRESYLYRSDVNGYLSIYDIRKMDNVVSENKIHEGALTDFDFYKDSIVSVGLDGKIILLDHKLNVMKSEKHSKELFAVAVNRDQDLCCYGGLFDSLKLFDIK